MLWKAAALAAWCGTTGGLAAVFGWTLVDALLAGVALWSGFAFLFVAWKGFES